MTPDLSLLSGFARGVLLSLHVRDTCLHSGSWLISGFFFTCTWDPLLPVSESPKHGFLVRVRGQLCQEAYCCERQP